MHDALYDNHDLLGPGLPTRLAQRLGLELQRFNDDVANHRFLPKVKEDYMSAVRSGAAGTPSFFINGEPYEGGFDDEQLIDALRSAARAHAPRMTEGHHASRPRAH